MPKIKLHEPQRADYLYINPKTKDIHLLIPVAGGEGIATDNTCKTTVEMNKFFGIKGKTSGTAMQSLRRYKQCLIQDIFLLQGHNQTKLLNEKKKRLESVEAYIEALTEYMAQRTVQEALHYHSFSEIPKSMNELLTENPNSGAIILAPKTPDRLTRFEYPIFSLQGRTVREADQPNGLGFTLRAKFSEEPFKEAFFNKKSSQTLQDFIKIEVREVLEKNLTEYLPKELLDNWQGDVRKIFNVGKWEEDTDKIFKILARIAHKKIPELYLRVPKSESDPNNLILPSIEEIAKTLKDSFPFGLDEDDTIDDILDNLAQPGIYRVEEQLWKKVVDSSEEASVFYDNEISTPEKLSIATQFFLGITNVYCHTNKLSTQNFGQIIEDPKNTNLMQELTALILKNLKEGNPLEIEIIRLINNHKGDFGLKEEINEIQQQEIISQFRKKFQSIKGSPHYDEFLITDTSKPGSIFEMSGKISLDFASVVMRQKELNERFINPPLFFVPEKLEKLSNESKELNKENRELEGNNEATINTKEIEVSMKNFEEKIIHDLHEIINDYKNNNIHTQKIKRVHNERIKILLSKLTSLDEDGYPIITKASDTFLNNLAICSKLNKDGPSNDIFVDLIYSLNKNYLRPPKKLSDEAYTEIEKVKQKLSQVVPKLQESPEFPSFQEKMRTLQEITSTKSRLQENNHIPVKYIKLLDSWEKHYSEELSSSDLVKINEQNKEVEQYLALVDSENLFKSKYNRGWFANMKATQEILKKLNRLKEQFKTSNPPTTKDLKPIQKDIETFTISLNTIMHLKAAIVTDCKILQKPIPEELQLLRNETIQNMSLKELKGFRKKLKIMHDTNATIIKRKQKEVSSLHQECTKLISKHEQIYILADSKIYPNIQKGSLKNLKECLQDRQINPAQAKFISNDELSVIRKKIEFFDYSMNLLSTTQNNLSFDQKEKILSSLDKMLKTGTGILITSEYTNSIFVRGAEKKPPEYRQRYDNYAKEQLSKQMQKTSILFDNINKKKKLQEFLKKHDKTFNFGYKKSVKEAKEQLSQLNSDLTKELCINDKATKLKSFLHIK